MSRILMHNREIIYNASFRAEEMKTFPSKLEEMMQEFLKKHNIYFQPQKIFYICAKDGWITKYYIADFYIPKVRLIIEVDGKFHDKQVQYDKKRTRDIQEHYPGIEVLRFKWKDLSDTAKLKELLMKAKAY